VKVIIKVSVKSTRIKKKGIDYRRGLEREKASGFGVVVMMLK
jgi:hypothetical protein